MTMYSKRMRSLAVAVAGIILSAVAVAQDAGGLKIAVVDVNRVLAESPQLQAARARLEDEFAPRQRELQSMQADVEAKVAKFEKDSPVMGQAERDAAKRAIENEGRALERAGREAQEDFELRNNEVLRDIQQDLVRLVQEFGLREGYDLIMVEGIIFASDRVNVTDQILEQLKADYDATNSGG